LMVFLFGNKKSTKHSEYYARPKYQRKATHTLVPLPNRKTPKLKLNDPKLIKIPVREVVMDGSWMSPYPINGYWLQLVHHADGAIHLIVNDIEQPMKWRVVEHSIPHRALNNGRKWSIGCRWHWYVVGADGRNYKFLYIHGTRIGTRNDHGARYAVTCNSKKQRRLHLAAKAIRLGTRKRRRWEARRERARGYCPN
jgi:hypothetical protein